jgi:hypothetical protein
MVGLEFRVEADAFTFTFLHQSNTRVERGLW